MLTHCFPLHLLFPQQTPKEITGFFLDQILPLLVVVPVPATIAFVDRSSADVGIGIGRKERDGPVQGATNSKKEKTTGETKKTAKGSEKEQTRRETGPVQTKRDRRECGGGGGIGGGGGGGRVGAKCGGDGAFGVERRGRDR